MAFCREDTKAALAKLAESCLNHWSSALYQKARPAFKVEADKSKIKDYVRTFTKAITHTPPMVLVDPKLVGAWAAHSRRANYDGNFEALRTRKLFLIKVPVQLIEVCTLSHSIQCNVYTTKGSKLIAL